LISKSAARGRILEINPPYVPDVEFLTSSLTGTAEPLADLSNCPTVRSVSIL
jgi:hypothetical protein